MNQCFLEVMRSSRYDLTPEERRYVTNIDYLGMNIPSKFLKFDQESGSLRARSVLWGWTA